MEEHRLDTQLCSLKQRAFWERGYPLQFALPASMNRSKVEDITAFIETFFLAWEKYDSPPTGVLDLPPGLRGKSSCAFPLKTFRDVQIKGQ